MSAYDDARAMLPATALAIADELIAAAPPLFPAQERDLQRLLGPYVASLPFPREQDMTRAQPAPHAA